jgi:cation:H+ antiporter
VDVVIDLALLLAGLVLLVRSADVFVDAAAALSIEWRIPPVVVGAVVIGLGTSAPEVLISTLAAVEGDAALGVGNVIGSNIANLSLVLGVAALLAPVAVASSTLRREAPVSVLAVAAFGAAVAIGLPRWSGVALLGAMVAVVVAATRARAMAGDEELVEEVLEEVAEQPADPRSRARRPLRALVGLIGTALGAQVVVTGAVGIADETGLSGGFVGLTLVAVGTSLPELVTAVQAARRGQDELILGNVLGSNIFNSLLAGGLVVLIEPGPLDDRSLATRGVAVMVAVSVLAWALMERRRRIGRLAACTLLAGYGVAVAVTG